MRGHIPGLDRESRNGSDHLDGVFLVRLIERSTVGTLPDLFIWCDCPWLNPKSSWAIPLLAGSTAHLKHFGG
jgi:hypothetical protein